MSDKFLTIKEASNLTGKAEITIRRMIKYLISQKDNLPTHETTQKHNLSSQMISQMIRQERQNDNSHSPFTYKISEELIRRVFNLPTQTPTQTPTQMSSQDKGGATQMSNQTSSQMSSQDKVSSQDKAFNEIVEFLKEQIKVKDGQIKDLGGTVNQLIERNREANILIGRLQERVFQLEAPTKVPAVETDKTAEKQQDKPEVSEGGENAVETKPDGITGQDRATERPPNNRESHPVGDTPTTWTYV